MSAPAIGVYANGSTVIEMDHIGQPFWEAGKEGRLCVPRCGSCGTFRLPPLPFCAKCRSGAIEWVDLELQAELYSYTLCQTKARSAEEPGFVYIPVVVELPAGQHVRLTGNLIDVNPGDIRIGMRLEIIWHPIADGWKVPIFRPLPS